MSRSGGHAAGGVPSRFNISTTEGVADPMRMYGRVGSQVYHGRDLTETLPNTAPDGATAGRCYIRGEVGAPRQRMR